MATPLPIDAFLPQIVDTLRTRGSVVLVAEPGAGKTTRVPPAILDAGLLQAEHPRLVMLQPRRVAARAAAARIADERGVPLGGDDVGYHVRFDKRVTDRTRLRVVTEGILTRQLVSDPFLEGVGCVVLDEFHERSLDVDLAIALLREVRSTVRPDLKLIVMSATLDAEAVARFLGDAPVINVPGRTFPVDVEYRMPSERRVWERVADEVERAVLSPSPSTLGEGRGEGPVADANRLASARGPHPAYRERGPDDVLVFLPGTFEIMRCEQLLAPLADRCDFNIFPLHGTLSFDEQQRALRPSDRRKVILATNIAETSLTIDGVSLVIDAGLARVPKFDPKRGLDRLELTRISNASATQRAGRAGRTGPGRCVRLWTSREHAALDPFELPEVRRVDLAPTVLALHAWGTSDPRAFGWFDAPDEATITNAERLLNVLGATDASHAITPLGRHLARLPVHPRIGRMLLAGVAWNAAELACAYAAILSEKDFVRDDDAFATRAPRTVGASDLAWRALLLEHRSHDSFVDRNGIRSVQRVRDELLRTVRRIKPDAGLTPPLSRDDHEHIELLLPLLAYPDRVCRRRESDQTLGVMVGGGGVRLHPSSVAREGDYFLALDARSDERSRAKEAQVRIAARIDPAWLERFFPQHVARSAELIYEPASGRVVAMRTTRFHDLTLRAIREGGGGGTDWDDVDPGPTLAAGIRQTGFDVLANDEAGRRLLDRLRFVRANVPEIAWPAIDAAGLDTMLADACAGKRSRDQVRFIDGIRSHLPYPLDRQLDQHAPEAITVPTGSEVSLDYSPTTTAPILAVRLQELFGLAATPRIANGRVPVLLHLLGPNYRPVQVTNDLASFWTNTYPQVRKDLRARYPKHSWPDDPLEAQAIRGPRKRGER